MQRICKKSPLNIACFLNFLPVASTTKACKNTCCFKSSFTCFDYSPHQNSDLSASLKYVKWNNHRTFLRKVIVTSSLHILYYYKEIYINKFVFECYKVTEFTYFFIMYSFYHYCAAIFLLYNVFRLMTFMPSK